LTNSEYCPGRRREGERPEGGREGGGEEGIARRLRLRRRRGRAEAGRERGREGERGRGIGRPAWPVHVMRREGRAGSATGGVGVTSSPSSLPPSAAASAVLVGARTGPRKRGA